MPTQTLIGRKYNIGIWDKFTVSIALNCSEKNVDVSKLFDGFKAVENLHTVWKQLSVSDVLLSHIKQLAKLNENQLVR